jgi:hypothetical protein
MAEMTIRERIDKLHQINKEHDLPYLFQIGDKDEPAHYEMTQRMTPEIILKIKDETGFNVVLFKEGDWETIEAAQDEAFRRLVAKRRSEEILVVSEK